MYKKKIPVAEPDLSGNELAYIADAIQKEGRVSSSGKYIDRFESEFANFCERKYAVSCSNGTTALHLALLGLGVGEGDEVIIPTFTFISTAAVVLHVGATPVFIDSRKDNWTLDESLLDSLLTKKTKALIAVDIYGIPCNYDRIQDWCRKNNVFLIEDAAEAHGAIYKGKKVGSFGDASCFSFFGNKIITTGEGGMVLTDDETVFEKMKVYKNHGMKKAGVYVHDVVGFNFRLTNIQAAMGCAQLERIDSFLSRRKANDALYRSLLSDVASIQFQALSDDFVPAPWFFNVLVSGEVVSLREALLGDNIETRPMFYPVHTQLPYRRYSKGVYPVAEDLSVRGITLPSSPLLQKEEIEYIVESFIKHLK